MIRARCREIDNVARDCAANASVNILEGLNLHLNDKHVALYFAMEDEFATDPLLTYLSSVGAYCYLPILTADNRLRFMAYEEGDLVEPNQYGIPEPLSQSEIDLPDLDLVFVPLVAFDRSGHRLGKGGGFYDRTFAFKRENKKSKPKLIGLAYAVQEVPNISSDVWDVKLDGILTEIELIVVN